MRAGLRYKSNDRRVIACKRAVQAAGGMSVLAAKLKIKPQAIYGWEIVPPGRCRKVAEFSGVPEHILRPDIFPRLKRKTARPAEAKVSALQD